MSRKASRAKLEKEESTPLLNTDEINLEIEVGERNPSSSSSRQGSLPSSPLKPRASDSNSKLILLNQYSLGNFRDLHSGSDKVCPRRLYRSATTSSAKAEEIDRMLAEVNIMTIIDLRSKEEALKDDHRWVNNYYKEEHLTDFIATRNYYGMKNGEMAKERRLYRCVFAARSSVTRGIFSNMTFFERLKLIMYGIGGLCSESSKDAAKSVVFATLNRMGLKGLYRVFLDYCQKYIVRVLKVVASAESQPILFHCAHGKDRTGVIAMLILKLAGATDDEVISDYARSDEYGQTEEALLKFADVPQMDTTIFCRAPEETMRATLDYVKKKYGGTEKYLEKIGFSESWRERLIVAVCAPSSNELSRHQSA